MLGYLETTRSDISYATHQCARFSANPKVEHGDAIRWIGRYLKGTPDKGTIFKSKGSMLALTTYSDTDYAGLLQVLPTKRISSIHSKTQR